MNALIAFLNARFDEDEQVAENARDLTQVARQGGYAMVMAFGDSAYIAHYGRDRAIREIEAKRRILAVHRPYVPEPDQACLGCYGGIEWETCPVLRAMASVYSDHPEYQKEWTP